MIFTRGLIPAILEGRKTQTRRLVKPGDNLAYLKVAEHPRRGNPRFVKVVLSSNGRTRYQAPKEYAIQPGRGQQSIGRAIRVLEIDQQRLLDIRPEDCLAEGITAGREFSTPIWAFAHLWDSINKVPGTRWNDNPLVWVLHFELVK